MSIFKEVWQFWLYLDPLILYICMFYGVWKYVLEDSYKMLNARDFPKTAPESMLWCRLKIMRKL